MADLDKSRLIQILGMLGSDHDGERANAGKIAHRMLSEARITWKDLLYNVNSPATPGDSGDSRMLRWALESERKLSVANKQIDKLKAEIASLGGQINSLTYYLEQANDQIRQANDQIRQLKREVQIEKEKAEKAEQKANQLQNQLLKSELLKNERQQQIQIELDLRDKQQQRQKPQQTPQQKPQQGQKQEHEYQEPYRQLFKWMPLWTEWEQKFLRNVNRQQIDTLSEKQTAVLNKMLRRARVWEKNDPRKDDQRPR